MRGVLRTRGADPARWLLPAAVFAVVAAGYARALGHPFHFDDFEWIRDNPALRPPPDPAAVWAFRPGRVVPDLTFALGLWLAGPSPGWLRAVNVAIHAAAALLVGWIAGELARRHGAPRRAPAVTAIAALLFAAHPLATQAVTYLTQRITSLAALAMLGAVAAYLRARRGGSARWWLASWGCGLLAAFSKEMSVALPALLALLEVSLRRAAAPGRASWARLAPFLAIVPLVLWTASAPLGPEGRRSMGLGEAGTYGRLEYALTQLTVVPRYLALAAWPAGQHLDPWVEPRSAPDAAVLAGAALLAALTAAALRAWRRAPLAALGWGWFLLALAPESSVVPIRDLMMEHRAYLPLAGLCWAAADALARLARAGDAVPAAAPGAARGRPGPGGRARARAAFAAAAVAALVALLTAATHLRNTVWADELALWGDAARKSPRSARARNNHGLALEAAGRVDEAAREFRAALLLEPRHVFARVNLGRLYGRAGRPDEAIAVLEEALALAPGHPLVLNNLATAWWAKGDTARAARLYLAALAADPTAPWPRANLARLRAGLPAP